ncbi:MAG: DNA polymerase III subunit beta [Xylanivirga thermophila]|jgi:DNA polymerase III subunit beta|uniref:DNA polymerase III subunit beta n=1 Tax=Xylanivirga thermophila TaxID=2496273 RepID=UPI00101B814B|nr:DNA polymerase III subunit beta [Xylanivirga thermophila]
MKFICTQKKLMEGINTVQKAISPRTTLPILEGIYIKAMKDVVNMIGMSLDLLGIETYIECKTLEEGSIVIPARLFADIIRKFPDGDVEITVMDNYTVKIECYNSRIIIQGLAPDEYPEMERIEEHNPVEIEQDLFKNMIQQTIFAVASEETRPIYTGALLEIHDKKMTISCLDGYRLAVRNGSIGNGTNDINAVIPGRALNEISKIIGNSDQKISITIGDRHALFDMGYTRIITRLLEGQFINYKQIIPQDYKIRVKLDTKILYNSIERASLIAKDGDNNLIKLSMHDNKMIITSNSELGQAYEELPVILEGNDIEIAFNGRYLMEILRAIEDDEICMDFTTNINPCVIRPLEGENYTYLLLPVRLYS